MTGRSLTAIAAAALIVAAPATARRAPDPPPAEWTDTAACTVASQPATVAADFANNDRMLKRFDADWPAAWRSQRLVRRAPIAAATLRRAVATLACLAALPGARAHVRDVARPLFASRRNGTAAFEALDGLARSAAVAPAVRAAARTFHAEMRFEVDDPRYVL